MSRPEFIDKCVDCGKKIHNSDCRFFLCHECREKEKKIPLEFYSTYELHRIAKNIVKGKLESIFLNSLCEEMLKQIDGNQFLRGFNVILPSEVIRCNFVALPESKSDKVNVEIMEALKCQEQ